MAQAANPAALALRLPDPRFSVDFKNYALDTKTCATTRKYMQDLFPGQNKPLPPPQKDTPRQRTTAASPTRKPQQQRSAKEVLTNDQYEQRSRSRQGTAASNMPTKRSASTETTVTPVTYSPFPPAAATTKLRGIVHSAKPSNSQLDPRPALLNLPQPILEHILAYVFNGSKTVSITPYQSHAPVKQRHRYRDSPGSVDIRSIMMLPVLRVSHQMRKLALDILYRDSLFVMDLWETSRSPPMEKELTKTWNSWTSEAPHMVKTALMRAANVRLRLPVPSQRDETTPSRSPTRHRKDAQDDSITLLEDLRAITTLLKGKPIETPEQVRSPSPSKPTILRRKLSFRAMKRPHQSMEFVCRGDSSLSPPLQPRSPLSRLEIVFVKRNAQVSVSPVILELVALCSTLPVDGALEYYLELEWQRRLWALRDKGKWVGKEPEGKDLLRDLQALGQQRAPPRKAESPAPRVDKRKHNAIHASPPSKASVKKTERPGGGYHIASKQSLPDISPRVAVVPATGVEAPSKRSFEAEIMSRIRVLKGTKEPPTIAELQQIAADIRKGVY